MIKWFKRKVAQWSQEGSEIEACRTSPMALGSRSGPRTIDQHGLNFTVYSAQGGTIIELRAYNEKSDRNDNKLYVIRDDQDLGKELDHIITLEALRR